jgi:hypothetical protein
VFAGAAPEPDSADCRYGAMVSVVARDKMTLDEQKNLETQNAPATSLAAKSKSKWKHWSKRVLLVKLRLVLAGILLGYVYAYLSPLVYPKDRPLGFTFGFAHGGLMPMALPSLVIGKNVPIFAENNNGRFYKLGYICGINVCGLLFFGFGFGGLPKKGAK